MLMWKSTRILSLIPASLALLSLGGCSFTPPLDEGAPQTLSWCPPLPNCVSTEASTPMHRIGPFELKVTQEQAWPVVREAVAALPNTTIVVDRPGYIYAKSYSRVLHFVDYFEVLAQPASARLAVRSSSLWGLSDLGVNDRRASALREQLVGQGVIKAAE